jgi:hypothetical protein
MKRIVVFLAAAVACGIVSIALAQTEPATIILKGAPIGGVKFDHKAHSTKTKCDVCHHPSKPEKPAKSPNQKCTDCHTKTATPPMKTKTQAAFHNPLAKQGLCIDCHAAAVKDKKVAPLKCNECHKKENV